LGRSLVARVGIHDNFFDLGGDSLTATQVVMQVMKHFQLEVPLRYVFESPTVSEMAAVITQYQGKRLRKEDLESILVDLESLQD
jgi:acyl carrier protein